MKPKLFHWIDQCFYFSEKALKAQKSVLKGTRTKTTRKIRTSVHFYRPRTLRLKRSPKYDRKSVPSTNKLDQYAVIKVWNLWSLFFKVNSDFQHPLTTETSMKKIEDNNTLVFIVDVRANKRQIKDAVKKMYDIKVQKVNTLIRYV